jgi:ATP-dependent DNA helicase RecQ
MLDYDGGGETPETLCCDVCEQQASAALREESAMINFFRANKRRYTVNEAASILAQMEQFRCSEKEAKQIIDHLLKIGRLKHASRIFWRGAIRVKT